ncbi:hypothetical protein TpMuguga_03g00389 [Theileria parva strain Muguga]|uniref:Uncharacterized protein n=1 Tax=Theileria parva TaxID=5875 RepID=Q4MZX0_THEPA|nr:uncharacterized protein TpMuguga_03g00389 [Theileria parva strain Muguga]EAN31126.1 hypothetical protein TpMuguga_03g00389 [Theileria parva strain Muguga]|eukprot:XP_763409.1 hypothetical protein [Theileria parva strain Muguga]
MVEMDNFTFGVKSVVSGGLNLNFTDQILEIIGPLYKCCSKFSQNLSEPLEKINKLITSIHFDQSDTKRSSQRDPVNNIGQSELDPEMSKIKSDCIELIPKWQMIFTEIEKISSNLKTFSLKMEDSAKGIISEKKQEVEEIREPLPTQLGGKKFTANNLIDVLRYFPVPMTAKRKEEVQLRKDVILAHYQYYSAVRILEDLKQLPFEHEVVELVKSATITLDNTHKLLINKCTELILFNEYYKKFIEEYFIALDEPNSASDDYAMEFEAMISRAKNTKLGVGAEIKEEIERFKKWTDEIVSAIKTVIPKQVEEKKRNSMKSK